MKINNFAQKIKAKSGFFGDTLAKHIRNYLPNIAWQILYLVTSLIYTLISLGVN